MNRSRWCLVTLLVPIVLAGWVCGRSWTTRLLGVVADSGGFVFAATQQDGVDGITIWRWSGDLSNRMVWGRFPSKGTEQDLHGLGGASDLYQSIEGSGGFLYGLALQRNCDSISDSKFVIIDPPRMAPFRRPESDGVVRVVDRRTGRVLNEDRLGIRMSSWWGLCLGCAVASTVWVILLVSEGSQSENRHRVLIDLGLLTAFFHLPYIAGLGDLIPEEFAYNRWLIVFIIPSALAAIGVVYVTLGIERRLHVWATIIISCLVPLFVPVVLAASILRLCGIRSPLRLWVALGDSSVAYRPGQFGIADMLIATTGTALLLLIGAESVGLVPIALGCTITIVLAIVLSLSRITSMTTIGLCTFAITAISCGEFRLQVLGWTLQYLLMTLLLVSYFGIYGYRASVQSPVPVRSWITNATKDIAT